MALATILVVDDEPVVLDRIGEAIKEFGQIPIVASNGSSARIKLHESSPDVVLTDLRLPDTNGIALLKEIKSWDKQIPVAIITGYATVNTAIRAIKDGAYDYLPKPFKLIELERVVHKGLKLREGFKNPAMVAPFLTQELSFAIPSRPSLVDGVMTYIFRALDSAAVFSDSTIKDICLCLEEAIVNAIFHGNEMRPQRCVNISMQITNLKVSVTIEDEGEGFDHAPYSEKRDLSEIMAIGGHGLFLIFCLMDEVRFNEKGNKITLVKSNDVSCGDEAVN